jgi:hypothetical protein
MIDIEEDRTKLEKYILRFTDDVVKSTRSSYYRFPGYIVRVSDHIGTNSSGFFSIIPVGNGNYIIHKHTNGSLKLCSYSEIKDFVKHIGEFSEFMTPQPQPNWELAKNEAIVQDGNVNFDLVFGINKKYFSPGQINAIEQIVNQIKQKNNL